MKLLEGKVAVITGAASGIGRAASNEFAAAGARLVMADLDTAQGEAAAAALSSRGSEALFQRVDVGDEASVTALVDAALQRLGRLDVFVHAAGILRGAFQSIDELDVATWEAVIRVNLTGTFLCAKAAAAPLEASRGAFLCFASVAGVKSPSSSLAYGASKAGVHGLIMTLEPQFARRGIRVRVLLPAAVDTAMKRQNVVDQAVAAGQSPDEALQTASLADPAGIARVLVALAADESGCLQNPIYTY